jgi:hypothetical protein
MVTGENGTMGFSNITIPISAVPYGTTPEIYIDGQPASNQSHTQDANNYYVWYTTQFSIHQVSIVFTSAPNKTPLPSQNPLIPQKHTLPQSGFLQVILGVVAGVAIVAIVVVVFMLIIKAKKKKKSSQKP